MTTSVWYAAYGSNLSRERFDIYLRGGCPQGATHSFPGCRDLSPPTQDVAGELGTQLAFGGFSQTWGGGVAFVRDTPGARTLVRMYLITLDQFEDVVAQENWLVPGTVTVEPSTEQVVLDGDHTYRLVIPLGERDGVPVLTISQLPVTEVAEPTAAYLHYIGTGLRESHGLSTDALVDYLVSAPGAPGADAVRAAVS